MPSADRKPRATIGAAGLRVGCMALCVPGMGTILWGESPLYIIWKVFYMTTLKSTSRGQGWKGDRPSEGSLSANLRAYAQKLYQAEPQGESAQHDEARPDHCGMVNTEVVQRKIVFLPGETTCLSCLTETVEQSLRRCALTG